MHAYIHNFDEIAKPKDISSSPLLVLQPDNPVMILCVLVLYSYKSLLFFKAIIVLCTAMASVFMCLFGVHTGKVLSSCHLRQLFSSAVCSAPGGRSSVFREVCQRPGELWGSGRAAQRQWPRRHPQDSWESVSLRPQRCPTSGSPSAPVRRVPVPHGGGSRGGCGLVRCSHISPLDSLNHLGPLMAVITPGHPLSESHPSNPDRAHSPPGGAQSTSLALFYII